MLDGLLDVLDRMAMRVSEDRGFGIGGVGVRDEARLALEQLERPEVLERLQTLVDEGLLT